MANFDKEVGRVGINRYGGYINEEFLPELSGARAIQVYKEMSSNDDTVGAILFAIKMLIRQASWFNRRAKRRKTKRPPSSSNPACMI